MENQNILHLNCIWEFNYSSFIMNCHQILSGACNAGDRCFAVGSVEGIPFTVSEFN